MHKGRLSAERNHKGTLVLSITAPGARPLPVPKLGRGADELFLKHHNQQVSFERNESGAITYIQAGEDILFGSVANDNPPKVGAPSQQPTPPSQHISPGSVQAISQQRAKHALASVNKYKGETFEGKLKGYIVGFAPMVLMSGFGQACAFYVSKSGSKKEEEKAYQAAQDILWRWLQQEVKAFAGRRDLMGAITQCSAGEYQLAQAEALAYLDWLKKFAKAYLQEESNAASV